ncbi:hypothetical protein GOBAR_DD04092 [Gossypium barbadense]|nr:hypothetical protein GOBAR_DD04092 [Gossypium barbadense]
MIYDERMLQISELDEWQTHVKDKSKKHDEELRRRHDKLVDGTNQFKVGDKILLDKTDPRIATSELDANGSNLFTVLKLFPYSTVKVTHSEFGTFKVNNTRLKPYLSRIIDSEKEELCLREPS